LSNIKPRRIPWDQIRSKAEEFRETYVKPPNSIPVSIIDIVELDLQIIPEPKKGLKQSIDVVGFLSKNLKSIIIDEDIYLDPRYENLLRFTYAHEVGHLILHKEDIQNCDFRTSAEWLKFREDMSEEDLFWFEQQAYEFGGRLLVPKQKLLCEIEANRNKIEKFMEIYNENVDELIIKAISRVICSKFGVSETVIYKRIKSEKIWENLKL
jgi:Zn-dependent peptidase ImmA (M78 family)